MAHNEGISHEFIAASSRLDVDELENGKIKIWRDYFDMATYSRALQTP